MTRLRSQRSNKILLVRRERSEQEDLRAVLPKPGLPRVRGTQTVTAILPNGRVAWFEVDPRPASAAELNRLRRAVHRSDLHQAAGLHADAVAIRRLGKRVAKDATAAGERRLASMRKFHARMLAGDAKNSRRFEKALRRRDVTIRKQRAIESALVRRMERRQLWDHVVVASSAPLFAAYGQKSEPFAEHNVALTMSLGVWLLGDELSDLLSGFRMRDEVVRELDLWSYIAPIGNVATGWILMAERQHERFVTGVVATFPDVIPEIGRQPPSEEDDTLILARRPVRYRYVAQIDLGPELASGHVDDFRTFTNVPAVATLVADDWEPTMRAAGFAVGNPTAHVELGVLTITVSVTAVGQPPAIASLPQPTVAWMVDTRDPE